MLDIKLLRKDSAAIEARLKTKEPACDLKKLMALDERSRHLKVEAEELKARRNHLSKEIGEKKRKGEQCSGPMQEVATMGERIHLLDQELKEVDTQLEEALAHLPNLPLPSSKVSAHAKDNVCIKEFGKKPEFSFPFKNHVELNEKLHLFDFKRGAKIAGSGWPIYRNMGARLEWALLNYMLDIQLENGFEMVMPPHLVHPEVMFCSGQLPKFSKQLFQIQDPDYHLYLIPTSEVPLNGLYRDEILSEEELPKKLVAYTPCFRREAGALGAQERGLIRMHQFNKVEMFAYATSEGSEAMFSEMVRSAEMVLEGLNLHYRSMDLVTGDMSFAAARTVDIEVWLPGQNRYYEVSSISNCTDFQARRGKTRYKDAQGTIHHVHTLNGSGLATSRLMVALLENNQREDGSVALPLVLHQYLNGIKELKPS